jgi:hypothetical protein
MRRAPLGALLALAVLASAPAGVAEEEAARPRIYKWVDENGIAHYTTDRSKIPSNLRGRIRSAEDARREAQSERAAQTDAPAEATAPAAASSDAGTSAPPSDAGFGAAVPPVAVPPPADTTRGSGSAPRSDAWSVRDAGPDEPAASDVRGSGVPQPDPEREARARELEAQIASLEVEMAKDEERLKQLISDAREPVEGQPAPLYGVPELEELARRFPKLQADLSALRAERRRLDEEP